ncbi:hypothetical protein [Microcystis aeruginosa]|nr:hypothetical protein [Microcystis aeruginosa]
MTVIAVYDRNDSNNFGDLVAMALEPTFRTLNCHRSKKPLK